MKPLLIIALCLFACGVFGAPVTSQLGGNVKLAWDASATTGVTNYILYAHTNTLTATNLTSALTNIAVGTNLSVRVDNLSPGIWSFAVTALKGGVESLPSNILTVEVPTAPTLLRTLAVQANATLTGTNWIDTGYFRLRIEP